eukprot:364427-Chlamydomonas_euryale.AAC.2
MEDPGQPWYEHPGQPWYGRPWVAMVLDKNTCKVVAAEYDVLCVDKDESKDDAATKRVRRASLANVWHVD